MTDEIIPLDIWRRRVALVRATVFAPLVDLDHPALAPSASLEAGLSASVYRLAYAAERRARSAPPLTRATLLQMDWSL